jgi:hypothetical protein
MCEFRDGDRTCPAVACWCEAGEKWYCRWHSHHNKRQVNVQILDDLLANGIPRKQDWRDFYVDMMIRGHKLEDAKRMYAERHEKQPEASK